MTVGGAAGWRVQAGIAQSVHAYQEGREGEGRGSCFGDGRGVHPLTPSWMLHPLSPSPGQVLPALRLTSSNTQPDCLQSSAVEGATKGGEKATEPVAFDFSVSSQSAAPFPRCIPTSRCAAWMRCPTRQCLTWLFRRCGRNVAIGNLQRAPGAQVYCKRKLLARILHTVEAVLLERRPCHAPPYRPRTS